MKKLMGKVILTAALTFTAATSMAADYTCKVYQNDKRVFASDFNGSSDKGSCLKKVKMNIRSLVSQYGGGKYQVTWGHKDGFQPVVKKYRARGAARVPASAMPQHNQKEIANLKKKLSDEYENINTYKLEINHHKKNIAALNKKLNTM